MFIKQQFSFNLPTLYQIPLQHRVKNSEDGKHSFLNIFVTFSKSWRIKYLKKIQILHLLLHTRVYKFQSER
jgi:hypothetical protein